MFGVVASCQTIGSDIFDFGIMDDDSLWIVVLEWNGSTYEVRWQ